MSGWSSRIGLSAVVMSLVFAGCGSNQADTVAELEQRIAELEAEQQSQPAEVTTTTAATTTTKGPTTTATTRATTTTTEPELPTISSGVYIVPDEIAPGTYRFVGYMARLDAAQEIIDNELVDGDNGVSIMIVADTDAYAEINGEAILVEDLGPLDPIAMGFTEGTYLVGYDIEPGRYRISPAVDGGTTYWSRLDRSMGIIDNDLSDGQLIVIVNASDWALNYSGEIALLP